MLKVMLCGASDTDRVQAEFNDVVKGFGGQALHYLTGDILHMNAPGSDWLTNSVRTVDAADLCVFVIVERFGEITWTTEVRRARAAGKPFLLFCLDSTYVQYLGLRRNVADPQLLTNENARNLLELMNELESTGRQETIVQFPYGSFGTILRHQMANLFYLTLHTQQERNQRRALTRLLENRDLLTADDFALLAELAIDEAEEKAVRKRALLALADGPGLDTDRLIDVLSSVEQGVQRLAAQRLADLYRERPVSLEFFDFCVRLANASEDVGTARRLVLALLDIDLRTGIEALGSITLAEIGLRRRIVEQLLAREREIAGSDLRRDALVLINRCLEETQDEASWRARAREFRERLTDERSTGGG